MSGSPVQAVVDGLKVVLDADETLGALVTGIYGYVPGATRATFPYLVLGRRSRANDSGAMQRVGGHVTVQFDVWSDHKGPSEAHTILSRIAWLLERSTVTASGYDVVAGSLTCEFEEVFDEPDADSPERVLMHGVQRWVCEVHAR